MLKLSGRTLPDDKRFVDAAAGGREYPHFLPLVAFALNTTVAYPNAIEGAIIEENHTTAMDCEAKIVGASAS